MKRSVTRRRVSTRRATVPCASVACSSSSRLSEAAADFELMNSVLERTTATVSPWPETRMIGSGAGDAIASLCLGCVERAVGAREECIGGLTGPQRRDPGGNGYPHAGRERAPVEIGDDRA